MATIKMSTSLIQLVHLLADKQFHAGSALAAQLGITRAAIWKIVKQLEKYGIKLESVKGKGYRLMQPLELLDVKQIKAPLTVAQQQSIERIEILTSVDSTNSYLKNKLELQKRPVSICLAEQQTAGKGRLGRSWFSPFGANIYLSLSWKSDKDISELNGLSLVIGVAIMKALEKLGLSKGIGIKWPNDIYCQHQKLAGILIEIVAESHSHTRVIIGIGMNVNMLNQPQAAIDKDWTSIEHITQQYQNRNVIIGALLKAVLDELENIKQQPLAACLAEWKKYDVLYEKAITLSHQGNNISGVGKSINEQGHLLLLTNDGTLLPCSSGETSIKQFCA